MLFPPKNWAAELVVAHISEPFPSPATKPCALFPVHLQSQYARGFPGILRVTELWNTGKAWPEHSPDLGQHTMASWAVSTQNCRVWWAGMGSLMRNGRLSPLLTSSSVQPIMGSHPHRGTPWFSQRAPTSLGVCLFSTLGMAETGEEPHKIWSFWWTPCPAQTRNCEHDRKQIHFQLLHPLWPQRSCLSLLWAELCWVVSPQQPWPSPETHPLSPREWAADV